MLPGARAAQDCLPHNESETLASGYVQLEWPYRQSFVDVSKILLPAGPPFSERSLGKSVSYYSSHSSRAPTILYHRKQIAEAMYYNSLQSSRAATILYHL
jgi:hypothetical protein